MPMGIVNSDESVGKELLDLLVYGLLPLRRKASPFLTVRPVLGVDIQLVYNHLG